MKKLLALLLCLLMCFSLMFGMTACGDEEKDDKDDKSTSSVEDKDGDDKDKDKDEDKDSDKDDDEDTDLSDEELLVGKWEAEFDAATMGMDMNELLAELPEELQGAKLPVLKVKMGYEFTKDGKVICTLDASSFKKWAKDAVDAMIEAYEENTGEKATAEEREYLEEMLSEVDFGDETFESTYTVEGDKIVIGEGDEASELEFEVSKNKLTLTSEGITIEFDRK